MNPFSNGIRYSITMSEYYQTNIKKIMATPRVRYDKNKAYYALASLLKLPDVIEYETTDQKEISGLLNVCQTEDTSNMFILFEAEYMKITARGLYPIGDFRFDRGLKYVTFNNIDIGNMVMNGTTVDIGKITSAKVFSLNENKVSKWFKDALENNVDKEVLRQNYHEAFDVRKLPWAQYLDSMFTLVMLRKLRHIPKYAVMTINTDSIVVNKKYAKEIEEFEKHIEISNSITGWTKEELG